MKTQRLGFASHDGASRIHALLWQPDAQSVAPRGIVQIVHGMAEHIDRYSLSRAIWCRRVSSCARTTMQVMVKACTTKATSAIFLWRVATMC